MANNIIGFYEGREKNQVGMSIDEIREMDDKKLEKDHHYIQWIFPDTEKSLAVPTSPVLSQLDIDTFWEREDLQRILIEMFSKMMDFYGLNFYKSSKKEFAVEPGKNFEKRAKEWITSRNHNFLRLTRIMRSMVLLGRADLAAALQKCLSDIYEDEKYKKIIGSTTKQFWDEAITQETEI